MNLFACPKPAALAAIPAQTNPFSIDQTTKIVFQRVQTTAPFANETAMQTQSNWTTLLATVADTKVIVSPFVNNVFIHQT